MLHGWSHVQGSMYKCSMCAWKNVHGSMCMGTCVHGSMCMGTCAMGTHVSGARVHGCMCVERDRRIIWNKVGVVPVPTYHLSK